MPPYCWFLFYLMCTLHPEIDQMNMAENKEMTTLYVLPAVVFEKFIHEFQMIRDHMMTLPESDECDSDAMMTLEENPAESDECDSECECMSCMSTQEKKEEQKKKAERLRLKQPYEVI